MKTLSQMIKLKPQRTGQPMPGYPFSKIVEVLTTISDPFPSYEVEKYEDSQGDLEDEEALRGNLDLTSQVDEEGEDSASPVFIGL